MHEFSLAQGLHDQLVALAEQHTSMIRSAVVGVGDSAGIVVDSFVFGFNVLAEQHPATRGMKLVIESQDGNDLVLQTAELEEDDSAARATSPGS